MPQITDRMLKRIADFVSFISHPIFVPFYTVLLYFHITDRYFLAQNREFLLVYIGIVGILIPLLFFAVMYFAKGISDIRLSAPGERLFFSMVMAGVYLMIFYKLMHLRQFVELFPFFLGIFLSVSTLCIYNLFRQKPSIHTMAMGGVLGFLLIWSYYTKINILDWISIIILLTALVAAVRLYLHAHTMQDLLRGFLIGLLMQFLGFYLVWLYL